jgi:hypothetical protein
MSRVNSIDGVLRTRGDKTKELMRKVSELYIIVNEDLIGNFNSGVPTKIGIDSNEMRKEWTGNTLQTLVLQIQNSKRPDKVDYLNKTKELINLYVDHTSKKQGQKRGTPKVKENKIRIRKEFLRSINSSLGARGLNLLTEDDLKNVQSASSESAVPPSVGEEKKEFLTPTRRELLLARVPRTPQQIKGFIEPFLLLPDPEQRIKALGRKLNEFPKHQQNEMFNALFHDVPADERNKLLDEVLGVKKSTNDPTVLDSTGGFGSETTLVPVRGGTISVNNTIQQTIVKGRVQNVKSDEPFFGPIPSSSPRLILERQQQESIDIEGEIEGKIDIPVLERQSASSTNIQPKTGEQLELENVNSGLIFDPVFRDPILGSDINFESVNAEIEELIPHLDREFDESQREQRLREHHSRAETLVPRGAPIIQREKKEDKTEEGFGEEGEDEKHNAIGQILNLGGVGIDDIKQGVINDAVNNAEQGANAILDGIGLPAPARQVADEKVSDAVDALIRFSRQGDLDGDGKISEKEAKEIQFNTDLMARLEKNNQLLELQLKNKNKPKVRRIKRRNIPPVSLNRRRNQVVNVQQAIGNYKRDASLFAVEFD